VDRAVVVSPGVPHQILIPDGKRSTLMVVKALK
jgi:hypothetical protein